MIVAASRTAMSATSGAQSGQGDVIEAPIDWRGGARGKPEARRYQVRRDGIQAPGGGEAGGGRRGPA
jgi:hypothetical protein